VGARMAHRGRGNPVRTGQGYKPATRRHHHDIG